MDHVATCPSQVDLQRLFQGELPGPKVEEFAHHLESCELCARTLASLPTDDTLADALRQQSTAPMGPLDPALAQLMERLRALRAPASGTAETVAPETGISTPTGAVSDSSPDASYDLLAPPQAPDEIGRLGPYRVLQVLGQGGMGMVFKAEDPRLDRLCALKTMLPEIARKPAMKERFLREAKAAAKIEHDHIIPIYQVDEAGGVPYIAMPFLKGASLEDYLKQKEQGRAGAALTMPQIIKIAREIARGLAAAHERGMIHRDIKPANIWLDGSAGGRVKILDFGLARLSQAAGEQNLTQSGAIMGTPSYMAPEQAQAQKLDGRADLFSLGVILYRLCTGELPFKGHDPISTLMALAMHNPPPPSQINPAIPPALSDLVMRLLAKDPTQRTASADDVLRELQAVGSELSTGAGASSPVSSASIAPGLEAIQIDQSADSRMSTSPYAPSSLIARIRQASPFFRRPAGIAALAAGLLAVIVLGTVYWIQTRAGVIRVEITDPDIEVAIKGTELTFTGADPLPVSVRPGEGEKVFVVTRGDFTFETNKLFLKKGDDTTVKVELLDGVVQVTADGESIGAKALSAPHGTTEAPPTIASEDAASSHGADLDFGPWQQLFDGKSLAGWKVHPKYPGEWRVENGVLIGSANRVSFLVSARDKLSDFHLRVETRVGAGSSAGVVSRVSVNDSLAQGNGAGLFGYTAKINADSSVDSRKTGSLYVNQATGFSEGHALPKSPIQPDEWFTLDVILNDNRVLIQVNGQTTTDYRDPHRLYSSGPLALQFYNGATRVEFRKIEIRQLSPLPAIAPFDAVQAKAHQDAWAAHLGVPVEYTNNIGMKFRLIPPGEFMMGSTTEEIEAALLAVGDDETWKGYIRREAPRHKVILSRPVYLGAHEVTQARYEQVMGLNPSHFAATGAGKDVVAGLDTTSHPVEMVSWNDAAEFCAKLSEHEKLKPIYARAGETVTILATGSGYRLPTEAEWEFACRAGTTTNYWTGNQSESLLEAAWFNRNSGGRTQRVEGLQANPFGLYDIHGNVWEWVQDWLEPGYYEQFAGSPALDPTGPTTAGSLRVFRGGGWLNGPVDLRSAYRGFSAHSGRSRYAGFRVALENPSTSPERHP